MIVLYKHIKHVANWQKVCWDSELHVQTCKCHPRTNILPAIYLSGKCCQDILDAFGGLTDNFLR